MWIVGLVGIAACRPSGGVGPRVEGKADAEADAEAKADADADAEAKADADADAKAEVKAERVSTDWCIEGMVPLDEDVCYILPPLAQDKPRRLLVYLHGIVRPCP